MIYIKSPWHDPYVNLALEEYLFKEFKQDAFMLWRNDKAVIIGKNQNTVSEINVDYVRRKNIAVVRRLTGGGAVFHDLGNLNFSFIVDNSSDFNNFRKFTSPIIELLREYGVNAEFGGRNDLLIDGRKFSGNAQAVCNGRLLHHGTILFHADFDDLTAALNVDKEKISSKAVASVRSRVTNICEHKPINTDEFIERLAIGSPYTLSPNEEACVLKLADEKYRTWDWNFGYSPKYSFHNKKRFAGGSVEVFLDVSGGIISAAKIYGDFFGQRDLAEVERIICGVRHNRADIAEALSGLKLNEYFLNISDNEILEAVT